MPEDVEKCVKSLLDKWKDDPSSRPKPLKEDQSPEEQAWAICTASHNKKLKLEGPTLLGCAVTNRPFIKGLPPIRMIKVGNEDRLLVPMLKRGKYRHPEGILVFNDDVFDNFIRNFKQNVVGNDISIDARHRPELGALGWLEDIYKEGDFLYGIARPTKSGKEVVEGELYKYASVEFHPDWRSPEVKLSMDNIIDLESTLEGLSAIEQTLNERVGVYQNEIKRLEEELCRSKIAAVLEKARNYRDESGRSHSPFLLEWAQSVLNMEQIGNSIKLEDVDKNPNAVFTYLLEAVTYLLENLPGQVLLEEHRTEMSDRVEPDISGQAKEFWKK